MGKVIDITNKLEFSENPKIKIMDKEFELNASAGNVLKIMGMIGDGDPGAKESVEVMGMIFGKDGLEELTQIEKDGRKLSTKDLTQVMNLAVDIVMGTEEEPGE